MVGLMTRAIITQAAAVLALVGSLLLSNDWNNVLQTPWKVVLGGVAISVAIAAAIYEVVGTAKSRPIRYRGIDRDTKILNFMTSMLSNQEQCVISSNDLSWVRGDARDVLFKKAHEHSLTLVMPVENDLSRELVDGGATAYYYGDADFRFASRFTIVNPARADAWVAIGHGTKGVHTIRTIDSNDDPAIHLANDLYLLVG